MSRQIDAPSGPSTSGGSLATLQVRCTANPYVSRDQHQFLPALEGRTIWVYYCSQPSPPNAIMRLQTLKKELLPVHRGLEVTIPLLLLLSWPPPVLLDLSAIKPGVYNHLPEGFKGGREISDILFSLFISDPSFLSMKMNIA